jgi:YteA family regulatory protein
MLTNEQLAALKTDLEGLKQDLEQRFENNDNYDLERGHYHESMGELSSIDNHPADEGTALYEREKDFALNEHDEYQLKNITQALEAMKKGEYGKCVTCGKEISYERLQAIPETIYCLEHTPDRTVSTNRPIEEGVLMPPFGKFDKDLQDENVSYDAEDSWQEVAQYGTSEGPSDFYQPPDHYNDVYNESQENIGYVEDYENFVATDIEGKEIKIYPNQQHERYEQELDEEGIMTSFGDLPAFEHDPYVDDDKEK